MCGESSGAQAHGRGLVARRQGGLSALKFAANHLNGKHPPLPFALHAALR